MKRVILITGVIVYLLLAAAMLIGYNNNPEISYERVNVETNAPETSAGTEREEMYLVKNIDGRIAVSDAVSGEIIKKTDTLVSILPEKDRNMLKKGIKVKSDEELRALLEDFCS